MDEEFDEEFREQAIAALIDMGLTEDEAELEFEDYYESGIL